MNLTFWEKVWLYFTIGVVALGLLLVGSMPLWIRFVSPYE